MRCAAARGARTALPVACSVQRYISAEGQSLRSAKEFLLRQSRSLRQRRSALRAASLQWHQDLHRAQEAVQDPNSSQLLQGMHWNLEEVSPGCCLCSGVGWHKLPAALVSAPGSVILWVWAW